MFPLNKNLVSANELIRHITWLLEFKRTFGDEWAVHIDLETWSSDVKNNIKIQLHIHFFGLVSWQLTSKSIHWSGGDSNPAQLGSKNLYVHLAALRRTSSPPLHWLVRTKSSRWPTRWSHSGSTGTSFPTPDSRPETAASSRRRSSTTLKSPTWASRSSFVALKLMQQKLAHGDQLYSFLISK